MMLLLVILETVNFLGRCPRLSGLQTQQQQQPSCHGVHECMWCYVCTYVCIYKECMSVRRVCDCVYVCTCIDRRCKLRLRHLTTCSYVRTPLPSSIQWHSPEEDMRHGQGPQKGPGHSAGKQQLPAAHQNGVHREEAITRSEVQSNTSFEGVWWLG